MSDHILARTRAIVERVAGAHRTPPVVTRDTKLADGFWLDSVEMLDVVIACETEFGFVFSEHGDLDVSALDTLGSLVDVIARRVAEAEGSSS
jgi:acyl carrier protein